MVESVGLIGDFLGFWPQVWASFWALSPIEKVTNVLALATLTFGIGTYGMRSMVRSRTRSIKSQRDKLEELVAELQIERDKLEDKLEAEVAKHEAHAKELSSSLPSAMVALAVKERADGNEERAVAALRDGFEAQRPDLTRICADLAMHHASLAPDFGDHHLAEAARLAEIAFHLSPDDPEARDIRAELIEIDADNAARAGIYDPLDPRWDDARFFLHLGSEADAAAAFDILVAKGLAENEAGRPQRAERLLRRAQAIGTRLFGETDPRTLTAVWPWLRAAGNLAKPEQVLAITTDLLARLDPFTESAAGANFYRCQALGKLGRLEEALKLIDANIELWTRLREADDRDTLASRNLRVSLLGSAGETAKALAEVEALLPLIERVHGATEHETLAARYARAELLQEAGETAKALAEAEALLSTTERVHGTSHPETLGCRYLRAKIWAANGRGSEARTELETIVPLVATKISETHPFFRHAGALLDEIDAKAAGQ